MNSLKEEERMNLILLQNMMNIITTGEFANSFIIIATTGQQQLLVTINTNNIMI